MLHNARRRGNIRDIADLRTAHGKKTAPIINAENIKDLDTKFKESFRKEAIETKKSSKIIVQKAIAEPMAIVNYEPVYEVITDGDLKLGIIDSLNWSGNEVLNPVLMKESKVDRLLDS